MKHLNLFFLIFSLFIASNIIASNKSFADQIIKVDGKKVVFKLSTNKRPKIGDIIHLVDSRSNQVGFIQVTKIKGNLGTGDVKKGTASIGNKLAIKPSRKIASVDGKYSSLDSKSSLGAMIGFNSQKLNLKSNGTSVSFSGTNPSLSGFYQMLLNPTTKVKFTAEYLIFKVGSSLGDTSVSINVTYLSLEGLGNYYITPSFWVGGGFTYMLPLSKSTYEGYSLDNVSSANTLVVSLGYDLHLNKKNFVPFSFSYGTFAGGESASIIGLKAGYGWNF